MNTERDAVMRIKDVPLLDITELEKLTKAEILNEIEQNRQAVLKFFFAMKKESDNRVRELENNPELALSALMDDYRKQMDQPKPVKMGRPGLNDDVIQRIRALRAQGLSVRAIADKVGVSVGSVHKIVAKP